MFGRRFKTVTYKIPLLITIFLIFLGVLVLSHIMTQLGQLG